MAQPDLVSFVPEVTGSIYDSTVMRSSIPTEEQLWSLSNNGTIARLSEKKAIFFSHIIHIYISFGNILTVLLGGVTLS